MDENEWWAAPIGAAIFIALISCLVLIAAGGWDWFAFFLAGPAANWVQAIGSIVAILAAYKMGQTQIEAGRILDASKLAKEDIRKLTIIDAILKNLEFSLTQLKDGLNRYQIPTCNLCSLGQLEDACTVIKAIDIFACPSPNIIRELALLPRSCDGLFNAIESFDKSFDEFDGNTPEAERNLRNSITVLSSILEITRNACRESLESLGVN